MIILITGESHTGKTLLAQRIVLIDADYEETIKALLNHRLFSI